MLHESRKKITNLIFVSVQTPVSLASYGDGESIVLGSPKKLPQFLRQ